jgi:Leucine-rich repeat (LRR) protein
MLLALLLVAMTGCGADTKPEDQPTAPAKAVASNQTEAPTAPETLGESDEPPAAPEETIPQAIPRVRQSAESTGVDIEVIGVYRSADVAYVIDAIEKLLPTGTNSQGWSASGNRLSYQASGVTEVPAFAANIKFGKVDKTDAHSIRVLYRYDNKIPQDFHKPPSGFNKPPEDPLGPALEKNHGDWKAALKELRISAKWNDDGEIVELDLPSFKTSDATLAHVAQLSSLKKLKFSLCRHVTDDGIRHIAKLTDLEELDMFGCSVGNLGQAYLADLTNLKHLKLGGVGTEAGLRHLAKMTQLESLSIGYGSGYPVSEVGLQYIEAMKGLRRLRLDGCEVNDRGLEIIGGLNQLESLRLKNGTMSDAGMAACTGLANLRSLDLENCGQLGDATVAQLTGMVKLGYLNLSGTRLTDDSVEHLRALEQLSSLSLSSTKISNAGVKALPPLSRLTQLILDETAIDDDALGNLAARFPKLNNIWLVDTQISDEGLRKLSELTALQTLRLAGTAITDAGMAHLATQTELRTLDISRTKVTVTGLQHLKGASKLRSIRAKDSGVSDKALREFTTR